MSSLRLCTALLLVASLACGTSQGRGAATRLPAVGAADRTAVRTSSIRVTVADPDEASRHVQQIAEAAGGYIESSWSDQRQARMGLRVRTEQLDDVLDRIGALGSEQERGTSSADVTTEISDLEATLTNALALRDRLRGLLERTKKIEELLQIEVELSRVQTTIEQQEARLKELRSRVKMSIVDVELARRVILGPLGYLGTGVLWALRKLVILSD